MGKEHKERKDELKFNLNTVKELLDKKTSLVAVSKTKPFSDIALLYEVGHTDFGENKVQELKEKAQTLAPTCPDIKWHFIGHLQTNKINNLLKISHLVSIHSIDSIKLLNKILSKNPANSHIGLFLEVKTTNEEEKGGFTDYEEIVQGIESIKDNENFYFQGLMTMGKIRTDDFEADAKKSFKELVHLKKKLLEQGVASKVELSMGMSQDFKWASELGSNYVRVGSKIFGARV